MSTPHTAANSDARKRQAAREVQPDGDVEALAEAFKVGWHRADDLGLPDRTHYGIRAVLASGWLAAHDAAAREADRAEVEAIAAKNEQTHSERRRAEDAEAALAGLVAKIQATADEYEIADSTCCNRCADAATFRRALRALIPADAATALDKVRAGTKAEALREAADAVAALVPYGYGMNPDGTEDQLAMAYVEGHREAWQLLRDRADRIARQEADR